MKNSSDTVGNRNTDLPACSAVPQPTAPPAACPHVCISLCLAGPQNQRFNYKTLSKRCMKRNLFENELFPPMAIQQRQHTDPVGCQRVFSGLISSVCLRHIADSTWVHPRDAARLARLCKGTSSFSQRYHYLSVSLVTS